MSRASAWLALPRHGQGLPGPRQRPADAGGPSAPQPAGTTVQVGANPTGVMADPATRTVYVANGGGNTVSVINSATCNAANTSGCEQTP